MATARPARIELTADSRSLTAQLRRASAQVAGFAAQTSRVVGRYGAASAVVLGSSVGRGAAAVGRGMGRLALRTGPMLGKAAAYGAAGVGAALIATGADVRNFEEQLTRLGIAGDLSDAKISSLRQTLRQISKETGVDANEIVAGASSYVALTGDIEGATKQARLFAQVTKASGASMADVAGAAAAMQDALKIKPDEMEAAFSAMITQGKAGAVELKDLAGELSTIAPLMANYAHGTGIEGVRDLGAALQVTRKGFGSASEAATGLQAATVSFLKHADRFEAAGVKLFDKDPKTGEKKLRAFHEIIDGISKSRLVKDPKALAKAFGSVEGLRTFNELRRNAELFNDLVEKGKDAGVVQHDLQRYMSSDAGKMAKSWNDMKESIASAFTPERIAAFAAAMERVAAAVNSVVQGVEKVVDGIRVAIGMDADYEETKKINKKHDQRVNFLRWHGKSEAEAEEQVAKEDAARKRLRAGDEDWKGTELLKWDRDRIAGGTWSNKQELLTAVDNAIARSQQHDLETAVRKGMVDALSTAGLPPTLLKLAGDTVRGAVQNAPGVRRRPGG